MSTINKRALREAANAANAASWGYWESYKPHKGARGYEVKVGVKAVAQHCLKVDSVFIAAANPATVLALLDELAFLDKRNAELNSTLERWAVDRAQSASELEAAEKRIAELEALAHGVKQFSEFQICHYGATEDYAKGYIDCQNNYNKVLFAAAAKGEAS
ncbi:ead/Ea22-like family protein [Enterobacter hormaechei subsp. steigerwaltii]|nr:ead/Ea22-like family protein [Enterobacter hormaechei subsp. steigerwaltii]MCU2670010.1 ead/Ea22-like family protein [Enterobacter hormaechei subsp. steigerwaltii]MCU2805092.1 ead/Ea22-like family protein [Enterobacter hormaechei subsp. steigerwaltii]MCU2849074.1 ead/Ea22-like family protein [Enterobacter hormaechei subsp. steigerwaltii]MCU2990444.1 ead/Ea22-like family protein [Enterobacter hormaechei subsp. steigerwaltii]